jgi:hypothetical protein
MPPVLGLPKPDPSLNLTLPVLGLPKPDPSSNITPPEYTLSIVMTEISRLDDPLQGDLSQDHRIQ